MARTMQAKAEETINPSRRKSPGSPMSKSEALQVLGLKPGATNSDVNKAYHNLMKLAHPDKGGSDFLAQQINQARDVLIRSHKN